MTGKVTKEMLLEMLQAIKEQLSTISDDVAVIKRLVTAIEEVLQPALENDYGSKLLRREGTVSKGVKLDE